MRKFKCEAVGSERLYKKCNNSVIRMEEPNCKLRAHFDLNEFGNRVTLCQCRCLGNKRRYFNEKKYTMSERIS